MSVLTKGCALSGVITGVLLSGPMQAIGEPHALRPDAIGPIEHVLNRAALESPQWHRRKDSIQRDVHDITFLLEQSLISAEKSDHAERKYYAGQALTVLQRAATLGYLDLAKTEPVLLLIRQLLADQAG